MYLTIIFSILIFFSLWPYLSHLKILNFRDSPTLGERALSDRPARRTIGRQNEDVLKSITAILTAYTILFFTFYTVPELRYSTNDVVVMTLVTILSAVAFYIMTPANRIIHAYVRIGHIATIHFVTGISTFTSLSAILHGNYLEMNRMILIVVLIIGAMLVFSYKMELKK